MSLKHVLLNIYSVLCNAARKAFTVTDYYLRIRELFIFIFMAQNRKNNQTRDPTTTRAISRPVTIARKGKNNLQKVRKKSLHPWRFWEWCLQHKNKTAPKTQFWRFRSILSLSGPHCRKSILSQRSQATQIWGGRNGSGVPPPSQGSPASYTCTSWKESPASAGVATVFTPRFNFISLAAGRRPHKKLIFSKNCKPNPSCL